MTKFLFEHFPDREKHVLFENTGKEDPRTLDFVNECDTRWSLGVVWLEAVIFQDERRASGHKIVTFETAARDGEPYEAMTRKYGIQNMAYKDCTRHLKLHVKDSYLKSIGLTCYETAVGIRADETHRINRKTAAAEGLIYPLVDIIRVNRKFVNEWWSRQDFDLQTPDELGNCDFCFKKSVNHIVGLARNYPDRLRWWEELERQYGDVKAPLAPRKIWRGSRSAQDIKELAAADASASLFANPELDVETDCFCRST